jgi:hypothetical protein
VHGGQLREQLYNFQDDIKQAWIGFKKLSLKSNQQASILMKSNEGLKKGIRHTIEKHNKKVEK